MNHRVEVWHDMFLFLFWEKQLPANIFNFFIVGGRVDILYTVSPRVTTVPTYAVSRLRTHSIKI